MTEPTRRRIKAGTKFDSSAKKGKRQEESYKNRSMDLEKAKGDEEDNLTHNNAKASDAETDYITAGVSPPDAHTYQYLNFHEDDRGLIVRFDVQISAKYMCPDTDNDSEFNDDDYETADDDGGNDKDDQNDDNHNNPSKTNGDDVENDAENTDEDFHTCNYNSDDNNHTDATAAHDDNGTDVADDNADYYGGNADVYIDNSHDVYDSNRRSYTDLRPNNMIIHFDKGIANLQYPCQSGLSYVDALSETTTLTDHDDTEDDSNRTLSPAPSSAKTIRSVSKEVFDAVNADTMCINIADDDQTHRYLEGILRDEGDTDSYDVEEEHGCCSCFPFAKCRKKRKRTHEPQDSSTTIKYAGDSTSDQSIKKGIIDGVDFFDDTMPRISKPNHP